MSALPAPFPPPFTNSELHLQCNAGDTIKSSKHSYTVQSRLGGGTFATVYRCSVDSSSHTVALKIVKDHPAYLSQQSHEIGFFQQLDAVASITSPRPSSHPSCRHLPTLHDYFMHGQHLVLVFSLHGTNLFSYLKSRQFRPTGLQVRAR